MILLWFVLGLLLIFGIARYNESNKLFWILLFSYVIGFAGAKMVIDVHQSNKQSNVSLTQVYPTQASVDVYSPLKLFQVTSILTPKKVTALKSVSQVVTPAASETLVTLSEVFGRTRDQPITTPTKPPELCLQKDFLTLHDSG